MPLITPVEVLYCDAMGFGWVCDWQVGATGAVDAAKAAVADTTAAMNALMMASANSTGAESRDCAYCNEIKGD